MTKELLSKDWVERLLLRAGRRLSPGVGALFGIDAPETDKVKSQVKAGGKDGDDWVIYSAGYDAYFRIPASSFLTFSVMMNQRKTRSIRSSGVAPDEMAASSSDGSPQSADWEICRLGDILVRLFLASAEGTGCCNSQAANVCPELLAATPHSQALNSTRETGERMKEGAVMLLMSPLKDASDLRKLVHDPFCAGEQRIDTWTRQAEVAARTGDVCASLSLGLALPPHSLEPQGRRRLLAQT